MTQQITQALSRSIFIAWTIIAIAFGQVGWWALDRSAPFELVDYTYFAAAPGHAMLLDATVRRDVLRTCSVSYNRYLTDSLGYRSELSGMQYMTAQALQSVHKLTPNKMKLSVPIPPNVAPGKAVFTTAMSYTCNPLHQFYPIEVLIRMDVQILPP